MFLRSFSYNQELTGDMLYVLFKDIKDYRGEFDYSVELIEAALEGRIDITKTFNLFGYCKTVRDGNFQVELKRLKKQQYIIDDDNDDETGVKTSTLVDARDDYEVFEDNEELAYTVNKIRTINREIIEVIGIDLIFCMRKAIRGIPEAVQELANICEEYVYIGECIQIILASGVSFDELFPEEVVPFCKPVVKVDNVRKVG